MGCTANSGNRFGAMALALPRAVAMPTRASSLKSESSFCCSSRALRIGVRNVERKAMEVERRSGLRVRCATEEALVATKVPDTAPAMSNTWWVDESISSSFILTWSGSFCFWRICYVGAGLCGGRNEVAGE